MAQVLLAFTALSACIVAMAYRLKGFILGKVVAIVALALLGAFSYDHYKDSLGSPVPSYPEGQFLYVYHVSQGDDIVLWVYTEDRGNRLYEFKYDQDTMEKLEEAKETSEDGSGVAGTFTGNPDDGGIRSLETDDWKPSNTNHERKEQADV